MLFRLLGVPALAAGLLRLQACTAGILGQSLPHASWKADWEALSFCLFAGGFWDMAALCCTAVGCWGVEKQTLLEQPGTAEISDTAAGPALLALRPLCRSEQCQSLHGSSACQAWQGGAQAQVDRWTVACTSSLSSDGC